MRGADVDEGHGLGVEDDRPGVGVDVAADGGADVVGEEVALAGLDAEDAGHLGEGDDHAQAEEEAGHHRLGNEIGDGAEPEDAAATSTTPVISASAAERAAKLAASPRAGGPTAAADTAEVAVVALTTSWREVPSSA
jgi:hypothetical protein